MSAGRFGTDGIRALAGRGPLAPAEVLALGRVLGGLARTGQMGFRPEAAAVIGRDTRGSGPAIEAALARGLAEQGTDAVLAGVIPTPGVARAVRTGRFGLGIVVSASHNPAEYNGIKLFDAKGLKLDPAREALLERRLDGGAPVRPAARPGLVRPDPAWAAAYEAFIRSRLRPGALAGMVVALDGAHGAASGMFRRCLSRWGARVHAIGEKPDGTNINRGVGATAPEALAALVLRSRAQAGVAFDGDADRLLMVDEKGAVVDGDALLLLLAADLKARRRWSPRLLVATDISNLGLDRAVGALGGRVLRTPVGDRHVSERMRREGAVIGGEQSGHLILPESGGTGDGMLAAAAVLGVMRRARRPLSRLAARLERLPQVARNLHVVRKPALHTVPALARAVAAGTRALDGEGRLVVRYSGTEPLLRILAEGPDPDRLESVVASVISAAEAIR